jgi:hypothetical protein
VHREEGAHLLEVAPTFPNQSAQKGAASLILSALLPVHSLPTSSLPSWCLRRTGQAADRGSTSVEASSTPFHLLWLLRRLPRARRCCARGRTTRRSYAAGGRRRRARGRAARGERKARCGPDVDHPCSDAARSISATPPRIARAQSPPRGLSRGGGEAGQARHACAHDHPSSHAPLQVRLRSLNCTKNITLVFHNAGACGAKAVWLNYDGDEVGWWLSCLARAFPSACTPRARASAPPLTPRSATATSSPGRPSASGVPHPMAASMGGAHDAACHGVLTVPGRLGARAPASTPPVHTHTQDVREPPLDLP